ncbi:MAG: hypothetical protein ABIN97_15715 [Ginsengibacter sp.]
MNIIVRTFLRLLPITIIGVLLNKAIIKRFDGQEKFVLFVISVIAVFYLFAFLWTLYKDRKIYMKTQSKLSFIPTIIGIIFIISFFVTNVVAAARDKSPVLIFASYQNDFNGAWFEFREDGTYKYANIFGLVGVTYTRGKYTLKDSLIELDTNKLDDTIESSLLAIRKEVYDTTQQVMYQINHQHNVIDKSTEFVVSIEKPK